MRQLLGRSGFAKGLEGITDVLTLACGWWLLALSIATCVEMAGRKLFGFSLQGVDEVGGYTFAVVSVIGFSYTLLTRGHTRVDFFIAKLSRPTRAALNLTATVTLAAMAIFATYRALAVLAESIDLKAFAPTPLATPLWLPQGAWALGYLLFAVTALAAAVDGFQLAFRGKWDDLDRRHGPQTLEEEIEAETTVHLKPGHPT